MHHPGPIELTIMTDIPHCSDKHTAPQSCIVEQFSHFAELNDDEKALLQELERDAREYKAGTILAAAGGQSDRFFTLRSGWACAIRTLADGQRQVLDIFLPGQIMGLREMSFNTNLSDFIALTPLVACPFPRSRVTDIFDRAPRLTDLFFLILAREQSMLIERVINIGRRNAAQRLAHFVVEMKVRLKLSTSEFELPLNQAIIGDALSLSSVHVSRTFKALRKMGLLEAHNGSVRICDLEGLIEFSGFDRTYLEEHSNWSRLDAGKPCLAQKAGA